MAVGPSTTTSLNDLLPQIVAEAMFVASERSIMRGLVKNYQLASGQGKTVRVPIFPTQTAATVTEGNEIDSTEVTTDGVQLTITTAAIRTLVTDLSIASSASNVVADLGRLFGEAVARKIDQDAMKLFSGFTSQVGAWDAALSAATVAKAVATLRANAVPADALACVVHPLVAYDLKANMTNTFANPNAGIIQNEAMTMGYVGTLFGVPVYESSNAEEVSGSPGDYYGAVFHRDAIGIAMIGDIGIETQRRASYLGNDVVGFCHYGVGEIYDGYGVKIAADSSIKP